MKNIRSLLAPLLLSLTSAWSQTLDPTLFENRATLSFPGYTGGSEILEDFPVLLSLSPTLLPGFSYADCAPDGSDLRFADSSGTLIPHEIDTWNPNGTSLIWVRLPALSGTDTSIRFYWSGSSSDPAFPANTPSLVWTRYVAVWHLNSTYSDSAGNNHLRLASPDITNTDSLLGKGTVLSSGTDQRLYTEHTITSDSGTALSSFAISGWFLPAQDYTTRNGRLFSSKPGPSDGYKRNGFEVILSSNRLLMRGDASSKTYIYPTAYSDHFAVGQWTHILALFNGSSARSFFNGEEAGGGGTIAPITGCDYSLGIGNSGGGVGTVDNVFAGGIDEVRIYRGVPSDLWIQTEYASMAQSASFVSYGPVERTSFYPRLSLSHPSIENAIASFSGSLLSTGADAASGATVDLYLSYAPWGSPLPPATCVASGLSSEAPIAFSSPSLFQNTDYHYALFATNSLGIGLRSPLTGYFSTRSSRSILVTRKNRLDDRLVSLELFFGGNALYTNTLFAVYGPTQGGAGTNGWAHCDRVAVLPPGPTALTYTLPETWGTDDLFLRFFLVSGRVPDYDYALDFLSTSGLEYFLTDYTPTGRSVIETSARLRSIYVNSTLFCARGSRSDDRTFSLFNIGSLTQTAVGWRRDYYYSTGSASHRPDAETIYTLRMDSSGLTVNGEPCVTSGAAPASFTAANPLMIFSSYLETPTQAIGNSTSGDFFFLRAWDNDTLSREYLPVVRDGITGLFETQSQTFLSAPVGQPIPGNPLLHVPEYVTLEPEVFSTVIAHGFDYNATLLIVR